MDQIAASNNAAVRLLQGDDFSQFDRAEQMLRQAMAVLNEGSGLGSPPPAPTKPTVAKEEEQELPRLPVRRSRDPVSSFRSSASSTAAVCSCEHPSNTCNRLENDDNDMDMDFGYEDDESYQMAVESIELTQVNPSKGSEHNVLPLFNRALLVSSRVAQDEEIAAVILYNLALINQIKGLYMRRTDAIRKALKLYELAIKILQNGRTSGEAMVDELLVLSLFYNLGQGNAHVMSYDRAGYYFNFFRSIFEGGSDNEEEEGAASLEEGDYSFFFFNAMLFQGGQLPLAPAA